MSRETTLVVMAAGMGSRFGGLKQIEPMGKNGEIILDYSVFDAKRAGFSKVVFIIKKEIEKEFREVSGKRIEKMMDTEYVFQDLNNVPSWFEIPDVRKKPWGTGHAILSAKDVVKTPFAVINADDFYGADAFVSINKHLTTSDDFCMVGYNLENTLTENGTVARGICDIKDGYLKEVIENTSIAMDNDFPAGTVCSMNMWGLMPRIFDVLENKFEYFLKNLSNLEKDEFYIPMVIDELIKSGEENVKVLRTDSKWYGVTYKEDKESVQKSIQALAEQGLYNGI